MRKAPDILKRWRASRENLPVAEAAAMVPCTRQTWHSWERQDGSVPPEDMMARVCQLTGAQPNDFYHLPHIPAPIGSSASDPTAADEDDSECGVNLSQPGLAA